MFAILCVITAQSYYEDKQNTFPCRSPTYAQNTQMGITRNTCGEICVIEIKLC